MQTAQLYRNVNVRHETKPRRKRELDQADAEALSQLRNSRAWTIYEERLQHMLESECRALEQEAPETTTAGRRGAIGTLRNVLSVPDILLKEAKASAARIRREED